MLDHYGLVKPGMRILHFGPELGIAQHIRSIVGDRYEPCDLFPDRYWYPSIAVKKFDLVNDVAQLPSDTYDLILHAHVMEHIPCNETAVLWHLHRALAPTGAHVFAVPITPGYYESDHGELSESDRKERFGLEDHIRNFGREDLHLTLGMIFDLPEIDLVRMFGREVLARNGLPEWGRANSQTFWLLRKNDLKLR